MRRWNKADKISKKWSDISVFDLFILLSTLDKSFLL